MENKIVTATITVFVAIVMIAAVLVPVIDDAKKVTGNPVTYASSGAQSGIGIGYDFVGADTDITIETTSDGVTINGDAVSWDSSGRWGVLYMGPAMYIQIRGDTYALNINTYTDTELTTVPVIAPATVHVSTSGVEVNNTSYSTDTSGAFVVVPDGGNLVAIDLTGTDRANYFYVNNIADLYTIGIYTTGENDTAYTLKDGKVITAVDFEASVAADLTLVDGTTDVYTISNFVVNIGGESFIPYYVLLPAETHGHATSGAVYSVLGIIPMIIIVSLLVIVVAMTVRSRND